jgi:hypothetical protein
VIQGWTADEQITGESSQDVLIPGHESEIRVSKRMVPLLREALRVAETDGAGRDSYVAGCSAVKPSPFLSLLSELRCEVVALLDEPFAYVTGNFQTQMYGGRTHALDLGACDLARDAHAAEVLSHDLHPSGLP